MAMAAKGLAKLIEECGELMQVAGKKLAYYDTNKHPDGGAPLDIRMEEEIGDVLAAIELVSDTFALDRFAINARYVKKLTLFDEWHAAEGNNRNGVDWQARRELDYLEMAAREEAQALNKRKNKHGRPQGTAAGGAHQSDNEGGHGKQGK